MRLKPSSGKRALALRKAAARLSRESLQHSRQARMYKSNAAKLERESIALREREELLPSGPNSEHVESLARSAVAGDFKRLAKVHEKAAAEKTARAKQAGESALRLACKKMKTKRVRATRFKHG